MNAYSDMLGVTLEELVTISAPEASIKFREPDADATRELEG